VEWVGLITALVGVVGLLLKWWWGRKSKEEELLSSIHEKENELNNAIARNNMEDISVAHARLRDELRVLLRGKNGNSSQ